VLTYFTGEELASLKPKLARKGTWNRRLRGDVVAVRDANSPLAKHLLNLSSLGQEDEWKRPSAKRCLVEAGKLITPDTWAAQAGRPAQLTHDGHRKRLARCPWYDMMYGANGGTSCGRRVPDLS